MSDNTCPNCQVAYGPDDMFCENCGYDFITGSLPIDAASGPASGGPGGGFSPPTPAAAPMGSDLFSRTAGEAPPVSAAEEGTAEAPAAPSVLNPNGDATGAEAEAGVGSEDESAGSGEAGVAADVPRLTIAVTVDKDFFDAVVNDGEIDFPDPIPPSQELDLAGDELHIGRTSESRAIHPDIDVAALTGDQAVSSRHAVLRVANDGSYTLVDVGSTNGTFLDDVESDAITHGVPIEVKPGQALYVGAWTRLTIQDS